MLDWIRQIMTTLGYPGIALLMFLENVVPPIPSEIIMPLAGFISADETLSFGWVVLAGTLGSVVGALPLYFLGRWAGEARLKRWVERHGRWLALSGEDLDKAHGWFDRHGNIAVLICRMVPGVRSYISIPAGMVHMPIVPFLLFTTVGAVLWTTLLAGAGRLLGANYEQVDEFIGPIGTIVAIVLIVMAIRWVVRRRTTSQPSKS